MSERGESAMAKEETVTNDDEESEMTMEVDGEIVQLRNKKSESVEKEKGEKPKRRSLRSSIRESFRNNAWRRSLVRRAKSYEPQKDRPRIKPKRAKTMKYFMSTVPRSLFSTLIIRMQPPAPLLVEDPPSTEDGSDLEDVKSCADPALLNGSSGNFGSAGARSAPGTPQATLGTTPGGFTELPVSQPCSPGCTSPSIQRSPSHSLFTKCDKASLKHLSTSTPAMTAQAQLTEPPSPKTAKETKVPTTSKARQKKFNRHFPAVDEDEKVLNHYSCALIGDILLQGHLYITKNYFAFYSNVFGYVTKLLIPMLSVEKITKEKTARIIPNAVGIETSEDKHVFGSLMSRDNTYRYMVKVWEVAQNASLLVVEPDIVEPVPGSDSDSSETREGESGRESPVPNNRLPHILPNVDGVLKEVSGPKLEAEHSVEVVYVLKQSISKFRSLPRQSLILFATTLLLILLFLSAAVLLYRISIIQTKYSYNLQETMVAAGGEEIYSNLLQYQTHLHSKSAGAVHDFLDTNLDQIAKVRQSLEALSTLLLPDNKQQEANSRDTS
ncbi:GRAM domain-containing protein 2B-like isoform X2 [Zophobas morio]|uniref:GRAM domain-containing protein 2B-like isoform X2 n=1 Tax=Zophobas morio TaxID=2755281 RepID=UPI003083BE03